MTARTEPSWIITVKTPPGSSNRSSRAPINRCAVDDTGRNSVRPWRIPSSAAGITLIIAPPGRGALRRAGALARFLRGSRRRGGDRSGRGLLLAAQHDRDRGGDEPARIRRRERADQHREGETFEDVAAEEIEGEHRQEDGARRDHGARQRLVDAVVDHLLERV